MTIACKDPIRERVLCLKMLRVAEPRSRALPLHCGVFKCCTVPREAEKGKLRELLGVRGSRLQRNSVPGHFVSVSMQIGGGVEAPCVSVVVGTEHGPCAHCTELHPQPTDCKHHSISF